MLEDSKEVLGPVLGIERFGAHACGPSPPLVVGERLDGAEATCVVKDQECTALEAESHRGMTGSSVAPRKCREGEQAAAHAEIHSDDAVTFESYQDVLSPSADGVDAASLHASNELSLWLPENVAVYDLYPTNVFTDYRRS